MKRWIVIAGLCLALIYAGDVQAWDTDWGSPNFYMGKVAAPTVNDDVTEGYAVGDHWYDETNDKAYECLDATDGAAVWTVGGGRGTAKSTAVNMDVTSDGEYHATAPTIFKVDLSTSYSGKTFTFSNSVAGTTIWWVDAISLTSEGYGGAGGVSVYNNNPKGCLVSYYFPTTGNSGYRVAQESYMSYDIIP